MKERIGYRRLYDSIACSLAQEELLITFPMGECQMQVYLGPNPAFGITISNHGKYIVPGEASLMLTAQHTRKASESEYPRHFFTEITCIREVDAPEDISIGFQAKLPNAIDAMMEIAVKESEPCQRAVDIIAGTIGLRYHRQFVLELINETYLVLRGDDDFVSRNNSEGLEILESLRLNQNGIKQIQQLLEKIGQTAPQAGKTGSSALAWLLRAWTERDTVSKFMSLFIPIEIILSGYQGNTEGEMKKRRNIDEIRDLIANHKGTNASELLSVFNQLASLQRPSLASRFEELASCAKINGWEADVIAFKRFNAIRNQLLHRGQSKVQLTLTMGEEFNETTWQLEDIAERYVSWALFGDGAVYPSRWRPERNAFSKEPFENNQQEA